MSQSHHLPFKFIIPSLPMYKPHKIRRLVCTEGRGKKKKKKGEWPQFSHVPVGLLKPSMRYKQLPPTTSTVLDKTK